MMNGYSLAKVQLIINIILQIFDTQVFQFHYVYELFRNIQIQFLVLNFA